MPTPAPIARGASFAHLLHWHHHAPLASPPRAPPPAAEPSPEPSIATGMTHHSRVLATSSSAPAAVAAPAQPTCAGATAGERPSSKRPRAGAGVGCCDHPAAHRWSTRRACNVALAAVMVCGCIVGLSIWFGACRGGASRAEVVVLPPEWARFATHHADADAALWDYGPGSSGPARWGAIVNATTGRLLYPECNGASQSPVEIDDATVVLAQGQAEVDQLYTLSRYRVLPRHGFHSFQLVPDPADVGGRAEWMVDGVSYSLVQLHAHAPSEHRLNGKRFPLELHLIHANPAGELAGLAILYDSAPDEAPHPHLRAFWDSIFYEHAVPLASALNFTGLVHDLLLSPHRLYRYSGSLTVPPCTQDLIWHVGISRLGINSAQLVTFKYSMEMSDNARSAQALRGRSVLAYD